MTFKKELENLSACYSAIEWAGDMTIEQAWKKCERADWMLWYLSKTIDRKKLVYLAALCAETVLHIYEKKYPNDKRVADCIQACKDYSNGKITIEELRKYRSADAADAADAAADAADAAYAAYAAYASAAYASAADAASGAAYAASAAAAYASADAAADAAGAAYAAYASAAYASAADAADAAGAAYVAYAAKNKQHIKICKLIRKKIKLSEVMK